MNTVLRMSCVLTLMLLITPLYADTIPEGNVSGTWYAANSPYYITGNITVPDNDTLTIEPGVDVIFLGYYKFTIGNSWSSEGLLFAEGTAADSIRFVPQDTITGWRGLLFGAMGSLNYCDIEYARESGIEIRNMSLAVTISHCTIAHNRGRDGGGIRATTPGWNYVTLYVHQSTIAYNAALKDTASNAGGWGGGVCVNHGILMMDSCTIHANRALGWVYPDTIGGGGVALGDFSLGGTISACSITDNFVGRADSTPAEHACGGGIYSNASDMLTITDCLIRGNILREASDIWAGGGGIYIWRFAVPYGTVISHCDISDNFADRNPGIMAAWSTDIINCTFYRNRKLHGGGHVLKLGFWAIGEYSIINNILAYNEKGIDGGGRPLTCLYNDVLDSGNISMPSGFGVLDTVNNNGDSCDVFFNIFADPMFADTANGDLHLTAGSPCIDAGDPASPYDPDGTIADQGCYFFDQRMPNIALSATALDFGSVVVGQPADLPLVIYNLGNANLLVYDIFNNLAVFTNSWNAMDSIVLPGDSLGIMVTFMPNDTVMFNDTLWINNNDTLCYVTLAGLGLPVGVGEGQVTIPGKFALRRPLPNPCESFAWIQFEQPEASAVDLSVYDAAGRLVATLAHGTYGKGMHMARFDASGLAPGVYFFRLESGKYTGIEKIVVIK